ncbi:hypothetical protein JOM56_014097 [Amanita muscaria]
MPPKKARAASSKASTSRKTSVVTEDQVVEPTKTLKPRAKGKGKGKAKQQEEPDEDEEGEDQENEGKESGDDEEDEDDIEEGARTRTTERNKLDTICNQAILAICRLNVLHPPRPLRFGVWNSRPLDEVKTTDLLNAISKSELRPFATTNLLALIIEKEALDPTCMKKDPNAEEAPFLKLTQEAQNSDMELTFAGGRHRMEVTSRLEKKSAAAIARLQEQIEVQTHKKEVAVQKLKPTDTIEERITRLEEELKGEQEVRDTIGIWGVIVYDKAPLLANGNAGANHLSSNAKVQHYDEGPSERLDGYVAKYEAKLAEGQGSTGPLDAWLTDLSKRIDSRAGQVLHHEETLQYVRILRTYRPHFQVDSIYTVNFCMESLHNISGGMLVRTVQYGLTLLHGLFSDTSCNMADSERYEQYLDDKRVKSSRQVANVWENKLVLAWNELLRQEKATVATELLHSQLEAMDAIYLNYFEGQDSLFLTSAAAWAEQWPEYISAAKDHADMVAQSPSSDELITTVGETLPGKVRFVLSDHGKMTMSPPMPLMTKSVIAAMVTSLSEVETALTESNALDFGYFTTPVHLLESPQVERTRLYVLSTYIILPILVQFWSWFDWSAAYLVTRQSQLTAKDISAWALRTVISQQGSVFINGRAAADTIIFFVWRHLDAFISMQEYLEEHPAPERPSVLFLKPKKVDDKYKFAFDPQDDDQLIKTLKKMKTAKVDAPISSSLWPLDFQGHSDWRESTQNNQQLMKDFIHMAKIEIHLIAQYRAQLINNCPAVAYIRYAIKNALKPMCKKTLSKTANATTGKTEVRQDQEFHFSDMIPTPFTDEQTPPDVDVVLIKAKRRRNARSKKMVKEAQNACKRIESLTCAVAAPTSKSIDTGVFHNVTDLSQSFSVNIGRLVIMKDALEKDATADMDPRKDRYQPLDSQLPAIRFPRRQVFHGSEIRRADKDADKDMRSDNDDPEYHGPKLQPSKTDRETRTTSKNTLPDHTKSSAVSAVEKGPKSSPLDFRTSESTHSFSPNTLAASVVEKGPKSSPLDFRASESTRSISSNTSAVSAIEKGPKSSPLDFRTSESTRSISSNTSAASVVEKGPKSSPLDFRTSESTRSISPNTSSYSGAPNVHKVSTVASSGSRKDPKSNTLDLTVPANLNTITEHEVEDEVPNVPKSNTASQGVPSDPENSPKSNAFDLGQISTVSPRSSQSSPHNNAMSIALNLGSFSSAVHPGNSDHDMDVLQQNNDPTSLFSAAADSTLIISDSPPPNPVKRTRASSSSSSRASDAHETKKPRRGKAKNKGKAKAQEQHSDSEELEEQSALYRPGAISTRRSGRT